MIFKILDFYLLLVLIDNIILYLTSIPTFLCLTSVNFATTLLFVWCFFSQIAPSGYGCHEERGNREKERKSGSKYIHSQSFVGGKGGKKEIIIVTLFKNSKNLIEFI